MAVNIGGDEKILDSIIVLSNTSKRGKEIAISNFSLKDVSRLNFTLNNMKFIVLFRN